MANWFSKKLLEWVSTNDPPSPPLKNDESLLVKNGESLHVSWPAVNMDSNTVKVYLWPHQPAYSVSASTSTDWWHATNEVKWYNDQLFSKSAAAYKHKLEQQLFYDPPLTVERANALNNA